MGEKPPEGDPQPTEEEIKLLENEDPEFSDDEKDGFGEETSKKVTSLSAQKKHWREKHKKEAEEFAAYKKANPEKPPEPEPKPEKKPKSPTKDETIAALQADNQQIKLKQANPDLSVKQIKKAIAYAKAEGVETQEFIQSEYFQGFVKKEADKLAAEKSTPDPSNRTGAGSGTTDFANVTGEDVKAMDDDTFKKYQEWLKAEEGDDGSGIKIKRRVNM